MDSVSEYMKTAIRTIKKYIDYVGNTLKYDYNNGVLEGINNRIKVIKRIPLDINASIISKIGS